MPSDRFDRRAAPVALSAAGRLVRPEDAVPGEAYRCPGCSATLVLRRGERRRPHFAHRSAESCGAESVLHRAAKRLVTQVVTDWLERGGPRPAISRPCPRFGCDGGVVQDLPDDVTRVAEEVRLSDGSLADVVLFRGAQPAAAIEVVMTSRVGRDKARRLPIPWVELRAGEVLERPFWWVAVQDGLQPFTCPRCSARESERRAELDEIGRTAARVAERWEQPLAPPPYLGAAHDCWRCGTAMVVYAWPGVGRHSNRRPPDPVPATVRYVATRGGGDYWANCCVECGAVQGDGPLRAGNPDYALLLDSLQDS